ncbi:unknown; predicted coding region [Mycoplasmopsis pulmonis]|uniref:Uncharacterized protein n=1 Tax=Mycoplasmopsis pulmonis (strain UAB CTIP) TaxID=272635 RepID=Q98RD5_MYCPU|nr:hypothetical protein [Mycoplasmopsis pulmonis]CAC13247.1 unknown; predicted coding region [Mycoplasmopsis pulmonis]
MNKKFQKESENNNLAKNLKEIKGAILNRMDLDKIKFDSLYIFKKFNKIKTKIIEYVVDILNEYKLEYLKLDNFDEFKNLY